MVSKQKAACCISKDTLPYWTVRMTEPVEPFALAVIVVVPDVTLAAIPVRLPMLATVVSEELQVALTV